MIHVSNLTFDYPGTRALDEVSFSIRAGSITALVGPNGAGKTTLLRCLAALEEPVGGSITMLGTDILADPRASHRQIGYLSDFFGLYEELTVEQCLRYAAMSHGIPEAKHASLVPGVAGALELTDRLALKAGTLSRGQRQRLAIAQAIIHKPKFLLLDEPASGLDPEARHSLALLFRRLQGEGMTLLVSSHILSELEEYSTDMLVLRGGRIIEHAPLATREQSAVVELRLSAPCAGLGALLADFAGVDLLRVDDLGATFGCSADHGGQHLLLKELLGRGVPVCAFGEQKQNLQDAYLRTVKAGNGKGGAL
jgi:ABC-2 type transport system ATP-binding protein